MAFSRSLRCTHFVFCHFMACREAHTAVLVLLVCVTLHAILTREAVPPEIAEVLSCITWIYGDILCCIFNRYLAIPKSGN